MFSAAGGATHIKVLVVRCKSHQTSGKSCTDDRQFPEGVEFQCGVVVAQRSGRNTGGEYSTEDLRSGESAGAKQDIIPVFIAATMSTWRSALEAGFLELPEYVLRRLYQMN